ncbi:uncharacterized protein LOC135363617 isoform X2 [Mirounga angustirostris]|uniref:uncharacterized protein LOC135363617 isoform X2 n=1 Tax=Mirounga angustirostris TaxID=9716 RepID=UPI00313CAB4C
MFAVLPFGDKTRIDLAEAGMENESSHSTQAGLVDHNYTGPAGTLRSLTTQNWATTPTPCACGQASSEKRPEDLQAPPHGAGPRGSSRLRRGPRACCAVTFETSGGELLWASLLSLSAGGKRTPSSVGLAMALQLSREQGITLRGSAETVAEFFSFGINSILYQRGIYPSETFTRVQKYGLTLLVTTDPELIKYLNDVVEQLKDWLYTCSVQKLVRSLKGGNLILSVTRLQKMTVHPEKSLRKLSKMKSVQ